MEAHGRRLRAKEETKAYPVRLEKCPPARARALGELLFVERRRAARRTSAAVARSRVFTADGNRQLPVPGPKKA